jgi:hypothetical protein
VALRPAKARSDRDVKSPTEEEVHAFDIEVVRACRVLASMQDVLGDATAADLAAAWRLAFAVCGEQSGADAAAEAAVAAQVSWLGPPSPIELLSATYREVEPIGFAALPGSAADPLHDAWWALPMDQRAALWLRLADKRSSTVVAEILSLAPGAVTSLADAAQDQMVPTPVSDACPSRADLTAYVAGALPSEERTVIGDHVPECDTCADRLGLVERLQSLGDPESGPVPIATDAGRLALDKYLLAGAEALDGDPIDEEPVQRREPTRPEPPVLPPAPVRPPPLTAASDAPPGTVAAAALAAFRAALGEEDVDVPVEDGPPTGNLPVFDTTSDEPGTASPGLPELGAEIPPSGGFAPPSSPGAPDAAEGDTSTTAAPPADGKGHGRLGRFRRRRSEALDSPPVPMDWSDPSLDDATPLPPEAIQWSVAATTLAGEAGQDPDPDAQTDAGFPTEETDVAISPGAGDQAAPIGDWAPDDSAWAGLDADDDPPADDPASTSVAFAPPVAYTPPSTEGDEEEAVPAAVFAQTGDEGEDHPGPGFLRRLQLGGALRPKVLAAATAGVLAAGIIGAIVVHPKGFPHFETVNVRGANGQSLFPGSTADPATVSPPSSTPLIIIPPGDTQSTFPPGVVPAPSPSSASPPSSVTPASSPASVGHTSHASGGSSGPTGGTTPPTIAPPPNTTTTTTAPKSTTTTTTPPTTPPPNPTTTTCILFICN